MEEKIKQILEKIYSGNQHIGCVYNTEAITQLSQLFKTEMLSIIGEDADEGKYGVTNTDEFIANVRNELRKSQRSTLEERVLERGGAK